MYFGVMGVRNKLYLLCKYSSRLSRDSGLNRNIPRVLYDITRKTRDIVLSERRVPGDTFDLRNSISNY